MRARTRRRRDGDDRDRPSRAQSGPGVREDEPGDRAPVQPIAGHPIRRRTRGRRRSPPAHPRRGIAGVRPPRARESQAKCRARHPRLAAVGRARSREPPRRGDRRDRRDRVGERGACHPGTGSPSRMRVTAGPDSSCFATKPFAGEVERRRAKAAASRVDVITMAGPAPPTTSRRATANPSSPGSSHVEQHDIRMHARALRHGFDAVGGLADDVESAAFEHSACHRSEVIVVVDDEHGACHATIVAQQRRAGIRADPRCGRARVRRPSGRTLRRARGRRPR